MGKDIDISYQVKMQLKPPCSKQTGTCIIKMDNEKTGHKAGEKVTFTRYGTFGGWDEQNRWIDFYNTEII